jgi:hypothetical protein
LANLTYIRHDAVDNHARHFGDLGRIGNHTAKSGVPRVAASVDDQHVARAKLAERIANDRSIDPRLMNRYRRSGDAYIVLHGAKPGIHESPVAEMADGCGLRANKLLHERGCDLGRQRVQCKHSVRFL